MKRTLFRANIAGVSLSFLSLFFAVFLSSAVRADILSEGIWRSDEARYRLTQKHQEQLLASLKRITGLESIVISEEGKFMLGDFSAACGGSAQARKILRWAIESKNAFIIEDHSGSSSVNFGQMDPGLIYEDASEGWRLVIWRVRLDFSDFEEMEASRHVRQSFDTGITMLHELLHGLGYKDAAYPDEIGPCEQLVNHVRAELGVPLRDQYFGETYNLIPNLIALRLRFRSRTQNGRNPLQPPGRGRVHYLYFKLPPGFTFLQGANDDLHTESLLKAKGKR